MKRFLCIFLCFLVYGSIAGMTPSMNKAWAADAPAEADAAKEAEAEQSKDADDDEDPKQTLMPRIKVDVQERDGYTRIIIMPNMVVPMKAEETPNEKGELNLVFAMQAVIDMEGLRQKGMEYVYDMQISSPLSENLQLKVMFPETARYRFFTIQKRGILDVFKATDENELTPEIFKEKQDSLQEELQELKTQNLSSEQKENYDQRAQDVAKSNTTAAAAYKSSASKPAQKDLSVLREADKVKQITQSEETLRYLPVNEDIGTNTITISATEPFGLSTFARMGYLWIVTDHSDMRVPPVIEGPNKEQLGELENVEMQNGTAYRMKLPPNVYVRPEGEKFIWKLNLSGRPFALPSGTVRKEYNKNGDSKVILTLKNSRNLLRVVDPDIGDAFAVVTVPSASMRVFKEVSFVDLDIVPAYVGAVLIPKSDGIRIVATNEDVEVSRNGGLNIGPAVLAYQQTKKGSTHRPPSHSTSSIEQGKKSLFGFSQWEGKEGEPFIPQLQERRLAIAQATPDRKRRLFMNMAEFLIAHDMAYEALGYMDLTKSMIENAGLDSTKLPEYRSLRAVALIGARRYDDALEALNVPVLQKMEDIKFWQAMALAGAKRYEEAYAALPADLNFLKSYPASFRNHLLFELAELALQNKDANLLQSLTNQIQLNENSLTPAQKAGLDFYRGRMAMMNGLPGDVKIMLRRSINSMDEYYGTRSELALVKEQLRNKEIEPSAAIPRLERIRFAWRGDDIEAETNKELGNAYIYDGQLQKGLNILRSASSMMNDKTAREKLSATMVQAFEDIYLDEERIKALKPLEALAVYDEFSELLPAGHNGDRIIMAVVDKLASIELFTRAIDLMKEHMDAGLSPAKQPLWAMKSAALSLRDRKPRSALEMLKTVPEARYLAQEDTALRYQMLRARALADLGQTDEALAVLEGMPGDDIAILRLKADTAWVAGRWDYAAEMLRNLLDRQAINPSDALNAKQAQMILNIAIAYNLSGDTRNLELIRNQYGTLMRSSPLFKSFQVVARPMRDAVLSDRDTIMSHVFEADMFGDSLKALSAIDANEATGDNAPETDG